MTHELLAQLIEVTSVPAAEHRLKKPIEVPRPAHVRRARKGKRQQQSPPAQAQVSGDDSPVVSFSDEAMKRGVAVLASTTRGAR